jgi:hypothetical protein
MFASSDISDQLDLGAFSFVEILVDAVAMPPCPDGGVHTYPLLVASNDCMPAFP